MEGFKRIFKKINLNDFKHYLFFSILLIVTLISLGTLKFTQARYENTTDLRVMPSLAFFIVDVQNTSGQIKLEGMVPSADPYLYTFNVSNFQGTKRANVDLTYTIEIITTTNLPLNFRIFRGNNLTQNEIDTDTTTTDENGVYYRHLVITDTNTMPYTTNTTDLYTLWVEFPVAYRVNATDYAGIIDLVDIKINAEQVV